MGNTRKITFLNGAKRGLLLLILCFAVIVSGENHSAVEEPSEKEKIDFMVASPGGVTLRRASSFASCEEGELTLGQTDDLGVVSVSKEMLLSKKCHVVFFCKERFFCGALRTAESDFYKYDELYIELAPFAVR